MFRLTARRPESIDESQLLSAFPIDSTGKRVLIWSGVVRDSEEPACFECLASEDRPSPRTADEGGEKAEWPKRKGVSDEVDRRRNRTCLGGSGSGITVRARTFSEHRE